jgi:hypothetical protein
MKFIKFLALLSFFVASAQAARWGTAGCGLGALAFKDQPGKIQIAAATTNNILAPQTSAITSGTSGCYESKDDYATLYIKINHVALQNDIVRGSGETLVGLSEIYGCSNESELSDVLKVNFKNIYQDSDDVKIHNRIKSTIKNNESLANSCSVFS